jgi:hypothetical protein
MPARVRISAPLALLAVVVAVAPAHAAGPRLQSAVTLDSDGDGVVDGVDLRLSKKPRGKPRPSAFKVKGHRVLAVGARKGKRVRLVLAEGTACDAGESPVVTYRRRRLNMERRDSSPPRITCAATGDADSDGHLDTLTLTYSKRVRHRRQAAGPFPFEVDGYSLQSAEAARGRFLALRLQERSRFDTDALPSVTYRRSKRGAVKGRGGQAFDGSFKAARDRVAPLLLAASTADADVNGLIETIGTTWSEPVRAGGFAVDGTGVTAVGASGSSVVIGLAEGPHGTGARPALSIDPGSPVRDAAGNAAATTSLTPADGAAPVILAAVTADAGGLPGRLDTLSVAFSEPISHAADTDGATPFGVTGYTVAAAAEATGQTVTLSLQEGPSADTGARPPVGYARGVGAAVTDTAGNEAAGQAFAATADGVAPRLLDASTLDQNGNGRLDRIRFAFSEPIAHSAESGAGSFSVTGLSPLAAQAASGSSVDLTLSEGPLPDSGVRPPVAYVQDGVNDVADPAGNRAPSASLALAGDGAPPVVIAAATADANTNARLDRVLLTMSEPVSHGTDSTAPFSVDAAGFGVASVAAVGPDQLAVNLQEPSAPDTGSAPTLTYTGAGNDLLDLNGLESPARAYTGLTRDALAPQRTAVETRDSDTNGKLERVEVAFSEQVSGSTATAPFSVSGHALQSVSYSGNRVRLGFAEAGPGVFDTDERPDVGYSVPTGDLQDLPEGSGDTAEPAPAFAAMQAADTAGPVPVAAQTLDDDGDGKLDGVRMSFSENLAGSAPDASPPFALAVAGRAEMGVSPGAADELAVSVAESGAADGGYTPDVSVTGFEPVQDQATPANDAPAMTFSGTTDGVRPVLVSAQMGDRPGGSGTCERTPLSGINGRVDCVRLRWSEEIEHLDDSSPPYPVSLDNGYAVAGGGIPSVSGTDTLDVPLAEKPGPDRDKAATVTYSAAVVEPVRDPSGNVSLGGNLAAERACNDEVNEDNDGRDAGNPAPSVGQPSLQRRCAFDDDWFRVDADSDGVVRALVRPSPALNSGLAVVSGAGTVLGSAPANNAGQSDTLDVPGLTPGTTYWVHVTGSDGSPAEAEGSYCLALSTSLAEEPTCGPLVGQLVFTEAGIDGGAAQKFIELKNVNDFALDASQISMVLEVGSPAQSCTVESAGLIDPGEYVVVTDDSGPGPATCSALDQLGAAGASLTLKSGGTAIDAVDLSGVLTAAIASGHSLEVKPGAENLNLNDDVQHNWCRTWTADTRGAAGDGCDEYRLNEVLFDPASPTEGRAFVELAGNLPAKASSELLANWVLRGVNGETGGGTPDFVLPSTASPRANGTYVVADGASGATQVPAGQWDQVWDGLNLADPLWPDLAVANFGPRGMQLLRPNPPSGAPCGGALADAMGWRQTAEAFSQLSDSLRNCASLEGTAVAPIVSPGRSAARDNLASVADTSYNQNNDNGNNAPDFCRQTVPNPSVLNVRPAC